MDDLRERTQGPDKPAADFIIACRIIADTLTRALNKHAFVEFVYKNMLPESQRNIRRSDIFAIDSLQLAVQAYENLAKRWVAFPLPCPK